VAGASIGGPSLTILNKGTPNDRLFSICAPAAGMAKAHRIEHDTGVVKMTR
jgi:copper(I)-binding protein